MANYYVCKILSNSVSKNPYKTVRCNLLRPDFKLKNFQNFPFPIFQIIAPFPKKKQNNLHFKTSTDNTVYLTIDNKQPKVNRESERERMFTESNNWERGKQRQREMKIFLNQPFDQYVYKSSFSVRAELLKC